MKVCTICLPRSISIINQLRLLLERGRKLDPVRVSPDLGRVLQPCPRLSQHHSLSKSRLFARVKPQPTCGCLWRRPQRDLPSPRPHRSATLPLEDPCTVQSSRFPCSDMPESSLLSDQLRLSSPGPTPPSGLCVAVVTDVFSVLLPSLN